MSDDDNTPLDVGCQHQDAIRALTGCRRGPGRMRATLAHAGIARVLDGGIRKRICVKGKILKLVAG